MYTRLPHRVSLQVKTISAWKGATFTTSWATTNTIWANVSLKDKAATSEVYDNYKGQQNSYYSVITRNNLTISKANNTLVFDGKILHIEAIQDSSGRDRYLEIKCRCEEV